MARHSGFTLIELMIAVAIVAILASVAYPAYQDQIRKSRRADAQSLLLDIGGRQQQRLLDVRSYASDAATLKVSVPTQVSTYYAITITAPASTPPAFTATATPQGAQANDKCGTLSLNQAGTKTAVKAGATQTGCW